MKMPTEATKHSRAKCRKSNLRIPTVITQRFQSCSRLIYAPNKTPCNFPRSPTKGACHIHNSQSNNEDLSSISLHVHYTLWGGSIYVYRCTALGAHSAEENNSACRVCSPSCMSHRRIDDHSRSRPTFRKGPGREVAICCRVAVCSSRAAFWLQGWKEHCRCFSW